MKSSRLSIIIATALIAITGLVIVLSTAQNKNTEPFYGEHQAGIETKPQSINIIVGFNLDTVKKYEIIELFRTWTSISSKLSQGEYLGDEKIAELPPKDTGERIDYNPARITTTFGLGPSFFTEKFGFAHKKPLALNNLPNFPGDSIQAPYTDSDIVISVCGDDIQSVWHTIHTLSRVAISKAHIQYSQLGFLPTKLVNEKPVGRNLQGFLDGTENPSPINAEEFQKIVWVGDESDQTWMKGGTYLVFRKIKMFVEVWDRSSLNDQEASIGRDRKNGAELATLPNDSHIALARGDGSQKIFRRPYSYFDGVSALTGQWENGLVFQAFMKDPLKQFIPMQNRISTNDKLNEYIRPIGSAIYAILPGIKKGEIIGQRLFSSESVKSFSQEAQIGLANIIESLDKGDMKITEALLFDWIENFEVESTLVGDPLPEIGIIIEELEGAFKEGKATAPSAKLQLVDLVKELREWAELNTSSSSTEGIAKFLGVIKELKESIEKNETLKIPELKDELQSAWGGAEALVRTKDASAYSLSEVDLASISRSIKENNYPSTLTLLNGLEKRISELGIGSKYGFWDAASLLFREGLEALLIIASLLAFLNKSQQDKRAPIVWSGVGVGLGLSILIAVLVSSILSNIQLGPTREGMEGIVGIVSVALMLTVGIWLHSKSRIQDWNKYLKEKMGKIAQIARPFPLFLLAFVAVFREGAETIIFFWGLAPNIDTIQLIIGIALASAVLLGLGLAMIKFSKKLPLQWFFPIATGLMYYLAVKVLGQSLNSLQASGMISSHPIEGVPEIGFLGFSPSWEVLLAQVSIALPLALLIIVPLVKKKKPA